MKRMNEALAALDLAIDTLEDAAATHLAPRTRARPAQPNRPVGQEDDIGGLFSVEQLTTVKARLDDAIERLESALEVADGTR